MIGRSVFTTLKRRGQSYDVVVMAMTTAVIARRTRMKI